eukprot:scaffold1282_cov251-Pinguiococcus_pyrenoidosus.AAC.22
MWFPAASAEPRTWPPALCPPRVASLILLRMLSRKLDMLYERGARAKAAKTRRKEGKDVEIERPRVWSADALELGQLILWSTVS